MLKRLLLLFLLLCGLASRAQEGIPVYWDYLTENLYLLHPSMAGAANSNQIRLTGRQQWFDVEDAPNLYTAAVNGRVGDKVGLGAILFSDENGNFSQRGVFGTFAYHLLLSRNYVDLNQLSFGLSVGLMQNTLDESAFDLTDFDPVISGGSQTDNYFNVDIGMSYYFLDFYAHATVKNVLPRNRAIFTPQLESTNQRRYIASAGYVFGKLNNPWSYEPSIMFQATDETQEVTLDINGKVYHKFDWGKLWGGLSYRRNLDGAQYLNSDGSVTSQKSQYLTPFLGITYNRFLVGYTYSYQRNDIVLANGFHQITLGYDFGERREPYECNCPAVN
ncbi:type IX secretion system membrane protein PorP/SprF [Leeuwenhoekiella marinoflava]|uniref:PorP/SprF family type IX secretion system membrane protein n=1 Tax=Leeuwenhoekiella marinoflava TaxID=988 RepID=UPI000934418A|nr:type IX secretion system membrane protein PorP/SprF [Leeuwenhoekiella marinoflava]